MLYSLCPEGHLTEFEDVGGEPFPSLTNRPLAFRHCHCGQQFVWETTSPAVVSTLEVIEAPVMTVCDLGCEHLVSAARYRFPPRDVLPEVNR